MSSRSEIVRKAIFAKSNVAAVVGSGKLTAIFSDKAGENPSFPYGVFQRQAPVPTVYAFGYTPVQEEDLWLFKVYADKDSSTTKEPQELCEDLLDTWLSTLGHDLTLSGATVAWMAKFNDVPPLDEKQSNRFVYGRGTLMRIVTE